MKERPLLTPTDFRKIGYGRLPSFLLGHPALMNEARIIQNIIDDRHLVPEDMSCFARARLMVIALGGIEAASIYQVDFVYKQNITGIVEGCHAYVLPMNCSDSDLPLNDIGTYLLNIGQVKRIGTDVTTDVFKENWEAFI